MVHLDGGVVSNILEKQMRIVYEQDKAGEPAKKYLLSEREYKNMVRTFEEYKKLKKGYKCQKELEEDLMERNAR